MSHFAPMPDPPYYAVIFTTQVSETLEGYDNMAAEMERLAQTIPGYIGIESLRNSDGQGITVSYWKTEDAIKAWRNHTKHILARKLGNDKWYDFYQLRVAKVERQYDMRRHG